MESVKIGSVGLGRLGYEHAKNLAASIPGCVLHAICNVDTSRLRAVAEELGVPHTYTDFAAMCADPELDGIVIVSPSFLHVEQIKIAMEHGKHVAVEVPAAQSLDECWQLVNTAEKTQRHCMMLENCVYDFFELTTLNMAQHGLFGEILHVEGAYIHNLDEFWDYYQATGASISTRNTAVTSMPRTAWAPPASCSTSTAATR